MDNLEYKKQILDRSFAFSIATMKLIDSLSKSDNSIRVISNQLMRSATSIGANIVEGQASASRKDFANFISHALKSANETKYWISLLLHSGKASESMSKPLFQEATELSNILASTVIKLRKEKRS